MKKVLLIFSIVCYLKKGVAQPSGKLYGYVYEQNSGKKPVPDVLVKAFLANQTASNTLGNFILSFQNAQPGLPVRLSVQKQSWVVTDEQGLETNLPEDPQHHPHNIVMCQEAVWKQQNQANRSILDNYLQQSYQKKLAALNKQSKSYQQELDSLQSVYGRQQKEISEFTDAMSRINLDEVSAKEKEAYRLFRAGDIEGCKKIRQSLHSEDNFLKNKWRQKQVDSTKQAVTAVKEQAEATISIHRRNLQAEAKLAQLQFNFRKANEKLAFLATNDSTNFESLFTYAHFLYQQNQYEQAVRWGLKALGNATNVPQQCNAGLLLSATHLLLNNFTATEQALQQVLTVCNGQQNPSGSNTYQFYICRTQIDLGQLYYQQKKQEAAEKAYQNALEIIRQPDNVNQPGYQPLLARVQNGLGILYTDRKQYTTAETAFKEAVATYKQLSIDDPVTYELHVIVADIHLGTLYINQINFAPAEQAYRDALERYEKLVSNQPDAGTGSDNAGVFKEKYDIDLVGQASQKATNIFLQIVREGSEAYEKQAPGMLLKYLNNFAFAEKTFRSAIALYQRLAKSNPEVYDPYTAEMLGLLGTLYLGKGDYPAAEEAIEASLKKKQLLAQSSPTVYQPQVVATRLNLGTAYTGQNKLEAAEKLYWEIFDFCTLNQNRLPEVYTPLLYNTLIGMGELYKVYYHPEKLSAYQKILLQANWEPKGQVTEFISRKLQSEKLFFSQPSVDIDILNAQRRRAATTAEKLRLQQLVVAKRRSMVDSGKTEFVKQLATDYGNLSWHLTLEKQYAAAEQAALEGMKYQPQMPLLIVNIASALLLQPGKYEAAKAYYLSWKDKPYDTKRSFKEIFLSDLNSLSEKGVSYPGIDSIKQLLNQP